MSTEWDSQSSVRQVVLTDGAMGTELWRSGWPMDRPTIWAVRERTQQVEAIHRAYVEAGARVVLSNTFMGCSPRLGDDAEMETLNRAAVKLARQAAGSRARVLGDIGPLWDLIEPRGPLSFDDAQSAWERQAEVLLEAGVDGLLVETLAGVEELESAVVAVRRAAPRSWLAASVALVEKEGGGITTLTGESLSVTFAALARQDVDIVGFNCGTLRLTQFAEILPLALRAGLGLLWIRAGAGLTPESSLEEDPPVTPEDFAAGLVDLAAAGATWLGGCCGTRPKHIAAAAWALEIEPPTHQPG